MCVWVHMISTINFISKALIRLSRTDGMSKSSLSHYFWKEDLNGGGPVQNVGYDIQSLNVFDARNV